LEGSISVAEQNAQNWRNWWRAGSYDIADPHRNIRLQVVIEIGHDGRLFAREKRTECFRRIDVDGGLESAVSVAEHKREVCCPEKIRDRQYYVELPITVKVSCCNPEASASDGFERRLKTTVPISQEDKDAPIVVLA
jgi:hypothetical protein